MPARVAAACVAGVMAGAVPTAIFWYLLRDPGGAFPRPSEGLVLGVCPLLAGAAFAWLTPRPVWRRSVRFTAVFAILPALLTILVIYRDEATGLGPAPLAVLAAWILGWFLGALAAGVVSRVRTSMSRGGTPGIWLSDWWRRQRCHHDWELVEEQRILGRALGRSESLPLGPSYHYIRVFRCNNCGAVKHKNDRWSPLQ